MANYKGYTITQTSNFYTNGKRGWVADITSLIPLSFPTLVAVKRYIDAHNIPRKDSLDYFDLLAKNAHETMASAEEEYITNALNFIRKSLKKPNKDMLLFDGYNGVGMTPILPYCDGDKSEYSNFYLVGVKQNEKGKIYLIGYFDKNDKGKAENFTKIPLILFDNIQFPLSQIIAVMKRKG